MQYLVNALASHEVNVARLVLAGVGAHVAAINRAKAALTIYPQAPGPKKRCSCSSRATTRRLSDLRDDAERVMRKNSHQRYSPRPEDKALVAALVCVARPNSHPAAIVQMRRWYPRSGRCRPQWW